MKSFSNEAYYSFFSCLANRTRLAIIDVLKESPKTALEISKVLEQEKVTISHNLMSLEKFVIVNSRKSGKETFFSLNKEILEPLSEILAFHVSKYCTGLEECVPPEKLKEYMKHEAEKTMFINHG
jgi:ArsR family transcriptional regulator